MKKKNLYISLAYLIVGIAIFIFIFLFHKYESSVLFGLGGGLLGSGGSQLYRYYYWSRPERKGEYAKRMEDEKNKMNDERSIFLRSRAGHISYVVLMGFIVIVLILFSLVKVESFIILTLSLILVVGFVSGIVAYKYLDKKY